MLTGGIGGVALWLVVLEVTCGARTLLWCCWLTKIKQKWMQLCKRLSGVPGTESVDDVAGAVRDSNGK